MKLWEKIPLKKRILFLPVVVTVAVAAGAWYSVVPRTKDVIEEISELKEMTVKLSRMREKFSKLEALEGEDLNNSLQVVSLALPDNKNVARDSKVNDTLEAMGVTVLRFWGHDVKKDVKKCYTRLRKELKVKT